jgi:hypothetical protein
MPSELVATVGEHPQHLELVVDDHLPQTWGADRDHRDRVRVDRVGLAVVAGVEQTNPSSELRGHVNDPLTDRDQPLRQRPPGTVGALYRPDSRRPRFHVAQHRLVAGLVGGEPARAQQRALVVDDFDGVRPLVRVDTDLHLVHCPTCLTCITTRVRRGGQCYFELGRPLLSHASSRCPASRRPDESHTHDRWAAARESVPPDTSTKPRDGQIVRPVKK